MKKKCESCNKSTNDVGRITKYSVLLGKKTTKFGNDMMMFKELWLCKECIKKRNKNNMLIFNNK